MEVVCRRKRILSVEEEYVEAVEWCLEHKCGPKKAIRTGAWPSIKISKLKYRYTCGLLIMTAGCALGSDGSSHRRIE